MQFSSPFLAFFFLRPVDVQLNLFVEIFLAALDGFEGKIGQGRPPCVVFKGEIRDL